MLTAIHFYRSTPPKLELQSLLTSSGTTVNKSPTSPISATWKDRRVFVLVDGDDDL